MKPWGHVPTAPVIERVDPRVVMKSSKSSGGLRGSLRESLRSSLRSSQVQPLVHRSRTVNLDRKEVDFLVTEFYAHDGSFVKALGSHSKQLLWRVLIHGHNVPLEIEVYVDKSLVSSPEVGVKVNEKRAFPESGEATKGKLKQDFVQTWPFRGSVEGLGERNRFEMWSDSSSGGGTDMWYQATLTRQRNDGCFEAVVMMPDGPERSKEVMFNAVAVKDLRVRQTKEKLEVPKRVLELRVPADNPLYATLSVDGKMVTHHFARLTPDPGRGATATAKPRIRFTLDKERTKATTSVGHSQFSHFLSGEVRRVSVGPADRTKKSWRVQIGPFAEHTIEVQRRHMSRIVTLSVDGRRLAEADAEDLDCNTPDGPGAAAPAECAWRCGFRVIGEQDLEFEVFETNGDGKALNTKGVVSQPQRFVHEMLVYVMDEKDLSEAALAVDEVEFEALEPKREPASEPPISISPQAMALQYGVMFPYKVNSQAPHGLDFLPAWFSQFTTFACCSASKRPADAEGEFVEKSRPADACVLDEHTEKLDRMGLPRPPSHPH